MGGSKRSSSERQSGRNRTFIDPMQAPFLQELYSRGLSLADAQMGGGQFQAGVIDPAMQAFGDILGPYQQTPGLTGQIEQGQELINRNLTENILPELTSSAIGAGQLGGSRGGIAAGIAGRAAVEQQSDLAQNLLFNDYNQWQQNRLAGLGMAPMLGNLQFQPLQNLAGLIGRPTTLAEGSTRGRGSSRGKSLGFI